MPRPERSVSYIDRTRELYSSQPPYRWTRFDPESEGPPWAAMEKPLAEMRVALMASGGVYHAEQEPFHFRNDTSHREIPTDSEPADLRVAHFGYDVTDAARDPGCVLPLRALRELADEGVVGSFVDPALSFMGGIYSARRVRDELAPRFRDFVLRQEADLAYLVPA
ncbi:MAG: glycine/sarcosine/betaine reductase selenoprotein B family protein [Myxococcota bacterium]